MTIVTWILSAISIVGTLRNAMGKVDGFYIWIVSNLGWLVAEIILKQWAQVPMWIVYTILSVVGIVMWKKKKIGK